MRWPTCLLKVATSKRLSMTVDSMCSRCDGRGGSNTEQETRGEWGEGLWPPSDVCDGPKQELLKERELGTRIALARFLANVSTEPAVLEKLVDDSKASIPRPHFAV